jgi:hypothetical protein
MSDWIALLDITAAIVSVTGAILTIIALREGRRWAAEAKISASDQQNISEAIAGSLSTRFLGTFPDYLTNVEELIGESKRSLRILAVVPTHGSYTAPELWGRIRIAIEKKILEQQSKPSPDGVPGFEAVLLCGDHKRLRQSYETQYAERHDPEKWKHWKEVNRSRLLRFLREEAAGIDDLDDLTLEQFIDIRVSHDERFMSETYRGFRLLRGKEIYPFFCWLADGEDEKAGAAVFSIKTEDKLGNYRGAGFFTRDRDLLKTLLATFDYYQGRYDSYQTEAVIHFERPAATQS